MNNKEMIKQTEKRILSYAKKWKTYNFYKRNRWLYYIPFMQIKYNWIIEIWSDSLKDLDRQIWFYNILKEDKELKNE